LKLLPERSNLELSIGVSFRVTHYNPDPMHPLGYLRTRGARPGGRTNDERDEIAS
jgi:hypothetical protein